MLKRILGALFAPVASPAPPSAPAVPAPAQGPQSFTIRATDAERLAPAQVGAALGDPSLITGARFHATLQLRTPLRVLSRHGTVHRDRSRPPPVLAQAGWEGIWISTIDGMEDFEPNSASDVGQVKARDYLPFLLAVRTVVEGYSSAADRRQALAEELAKPQWGKFTRKLGGKEAVLDRFFPPFLETLKGLTDEAVQALRRKKLTTPRAIAEASHEALRSIKGIGPSKLSTIRAACAAATEKDGVYVDLVVR